MQRAARALRRIASALEVRYPRLAAQLVPHGSRRQWLYHALTYRARAAIAVRPRPPIATNQVPSPGTISFAAPSAPRVSVVVPVHGKDDFTLRCLRALAPALARVNGEVIVVDDASPPRTSALLRAIEGLRVVTLAENVGYIRATNAGLKLAAAPFVLLLNNDTQVAPNAVEVLVTTAEADASIGIVGARLVYPQGRLQEAGGIVFADGTPVIYGQGEDPASGPYGYVREVDYCSAAALLVRRDLIERVGGLDERYAPAFYEDTDLAFDCRRHGYKVIYQPAALVFHHEGASLGRDIHSGPKRFQAANHAKFAAKWADELQAQPDAGTPVVLARDRRGGPRVLVIDDTLPTPDRDSGSVRMQALLTILHDLGAVVAFAPATRAPMQPYTRALQQLGIEVVYGFRGLEDHLAAIGTALDMAILSRPTVASGHIAAVRRAAPDAVVVYDTVDLQSVLEARRAEIEGSSEARAWARVLRDTELALVHDADLTLTVTPHEAALLARDAPEARILVLPNIHEVRPAPGGDLEARRDLLFAGYFRHLPNVDAVQWFVQFVLPLVQQSLAGVRLHVVGDRAPAEVERLASADVVVHGWVPDLSEMYSLCRVFVAPLRWGAGQKGKIGESMAWGLPVVTTTIGAEGLATADEGVFLVADDAADFASAVVKLYADAALWERMSRAGRAHIAANLSREAARGRIASLLDAVAELRARRLTGDHP